MNASVWLFSILSYLMRSVSAQNELNGYSLTTAVVEFSLPSTLRISELIPHVEHSLDEYMAESLQIELSRNTGSPEVLYHFVGLFYSCRSSDSMARRQRRRLQESTARYICEGRATYRGSFSVEAQIALTKWSREALLLEEAPSVLQQRLQSDALFQDVQQVRLGVQTSPSQVSQTSPKLTGMIVGLTLVAVAIIVVLGMLLWRHSRYSLSPLDGAFPQPEDRKDPVVIPGRGIDSQSSFEDEPKKSTQYEEKDQRPLWSRLFSRDGASNRPQEQAPDHTDAGWWPTLENTMALEGPAENVEDPYEFPFMDFPRTDGTPCLLYSEDENGASTLRKEITSPTSSSLANSEPVAAKRESLTNDDFRRQLSMHSLHSSLEDDTEGVEGGEPEFTATLGRLVELRHRHYERNELVRRRDEQLRRHELEIDLAEIEQTLSPPRGQPPTRQPSHRSSMSETDFLSKLGSGPSLRVDDHDSVGNNLPPRPPKGSSNSSTGSSTTGVIPRRKTKAHRRSASHGTNASQQATKKQHSPDVVTLGLAAYTNFS